MVLDVDNAYNALLRSSFEKCKKRRELKAEIEKRGFTRWIDDDDCPLDMDGAETLIQQTNQDTDVAMQDVPQDPTSEIITPLLDVVKDLKGQVESLRGEVRQCKAKMDSTKNPKKPKQQKRRRIRIGQILTNLLRMIKSRIDRKGLKVIKTKRVIRMKANGYMF